MIGLDVSEILEDFPETRVALIVARDIEVVPARAPALERALAEVEAEVAGFLAGRALAEVPELRVWRAAYKAMGVKKTSYRSSVERLLKQIPQGRGLPRIGHLVDCYNAVSARHRLPIGADDLDKVTGGLAFRPYHSYFNFLVEFCCIFVAFPTRPEKARQQPAWRDHPRRSGTGAHRYRRSSELNRAP